MLINTQLVFQQDYNGTVEVFLKAAQPVHAFIHYEYSSYDEYQTNAEWCDTCNPNIVGVINYYEHTSQYIQKSALYNTWKWTLFSSEYFSFTLTVHTCENSLIACLFRSNEMYK